MRREGGGGHWGMHEETMGWSGADLGRGGFEWGGEREGAGMGAGQVIVPGLGVGVGWW